jgi:vanillate O-demethylase monooxygenase subunit
MDGANHMWRLWVSTRSKDVTASIAATFPAVMDQDRWALERQQQMFEYPDDGYHEVFLRSDQALVRCRRILAEMEKQNGPRGWSSTSSELSSLSPSTVT